MVVLAAYSNAQVTWRYAYGAFDNDRASVVRVVNEDLYFVAGSTGSFGAGASDIYLVALNALGVPQWSRTIGGIGVETAQDLIILADGGSMIVGSTSSQGAGGYDGYLVRTDANGDMLWERTFGGTDWDLLNDIKQVSEDRFLLTGQTYSNGQTAGSGWIMLVDATGEAVWSQAVLCGPGTNGYATASTDDGGFVCTGSISDPNEPSDAFVAKYDAAASLEWMYRYGGDSLDIGRDIVATMDGGYSIMGSTRSYSNWVEAYHLKIDGQGVEQWYRHWGQINDQEAYEHIETAQGGFASIGYTRTTGGGGKDMFLLFSGSDGAYDFGTTFGGTENDAGFGIALLTDGFLCAGTTLSFGSGANDFFVVRTGANGLTQLQSVTTSFDPLGMNEIVPDRLPIHPNPSTGSFFIPAQTVAGRVEVFDQAGRSVHGAWFPAGSTSLRLDLPDGAYVVQLTSSDGRGSRSRLMILHP